MTGAMPAYSALRKRSTLSLSTCGPRASATRVLVPPISATRDRSAEGPDAVMDLAFVSDGSAGGVAPPARECLIGRFRGSCQALEIHMHKAEALFVAERPFVIVHQRPDEIPPDRRTGCDGLPDRVEMAFEIGDAFGVGPVGQIGIGHAVLGDV